VKLLAIAESLDPLDGWGSYTAGLLRGLIGQGVQLRVLVARSQAKAALLGAEVVPCLSSPLGGLVKPQAMAWNAWQLLRQASGHDLLHFMVEPYATASLPFGLPPGCITVHGTYAVSPFREHVLTRNVYAAALRRARVVFAVSSYTREALLGKLELSNVEVVNNGHDLLPGQDELTGGPDQIAGDPVILTVGALKMRKGHHVSLRAVARLRERFPGLRYYLVGDDRDTRYVNSLRKEIEELGLRDSAVITGLVSDAQLRSYYRWADLFLLTPVNSGLSFEGFGIAYLEANAYGKPVVGSLGCGAEEAIEVGVNGLLAPQNDDEAVAAAAGAILGDRELAARLGAAGRARAEAQTWSNVARRYLDLYERAVHGN
jgi:glycosyltransferase involved in cell wall biosynthesis